MRGRLSSSSVARTCGLIVAVLSVACQASRAQTAGQGAVSPVDLLGVPAKHLVRSPSVAARSDTVFIAGNVLPTEGDSLLLRPLYLGRLLQLPTGELAPLPPLELPPGDFQFAYPRIGAARDAVHLVWAEFPTRRSTAGAWLVGFAATLWHSALRDGAWSTPQRIVEGVVLGWDQDLGAISMTDTGTLHVVVGVSDSLPAVRHIRLSNGRWRTTSFLSGGWGPSAVASRGDTVLVALVDQQAFGFDVKLFRSSDSGEQWELPTVAASRDNGTVASLILATMPRGPLLAIAEKPFNSTTLDSLRLIRYSGDDSFVGVVTPLPHVSSLVVAATPCASVVMLAGTFSPTPQIFAIRIPHDRLTARIGPLLSNGDIAAFPGVGSTDLSAVAVFAHRESADHPVRSVAMTLTSCTAFSEDGADQFPIRSG